MKVFVITNSSINNYGAILQAYALQKKLISMHADARVLRLTEPPKSKLTKLREFLTPKAHYTLSDKISIRKSRKQYAVKNKKLKSFYQSRIRSREVHSLDEAAIATAGTDVMIAGSDQIWSPTAHMLSPFTTLQFGSPEIRRYSYAASVGATAFDDQSKSILQTGLKAFREASVRESSTVGIVQELTDKPVHRNVDPTLLFDSTFWDELAEQKSPASPYVFVYMLRPEPLTLEIARKIAEETGKQLLIISNRVLPGYHNITDAGIEDWLSYIRNADYVVTNSFHGTVFAVQFRKQFLSVAVEGSGMRVSDFLKDIGLSGRIARSAEDRKNIDTPVLWEAAEEKLKMLRSEADLYLSRILSAEEAAGDIRLFRDKGECSACGACMNVCPKGAVSMAEDACGYLYPQIDRALCISCGLCRRVCAYQKTPDRSEALEVYAGVSKDEAELGISSSGGAFAAVARAFIRQGGAVFGAAMTNTDEGLKPVHIMVEREEELVRLQSSKYAQSEIGTTFRQVKDLLENGRRVLFSGTPCQIAGLKGYLQKNYDGLYLIDLICHGVPSARLMQSWQKMLEKQQHAAVEQICFRDKRQGWGEKGYVSFANAGGKKKEISISPLTSSFYKLYLTGAMNRENCYNCPYTDVNSRPGDLTIGDFWGIERVHPELLTAGGGPWKREKGISCLLVNDPKGAELLREYGSGLELQPSSAEKIILRNKMLVRPARYFGRRKELLSLYQAGGYPAVDKWFWKTYGFRLKTTELRRKITRKIRKILK